MKSKDKFNMNIVINQGSLASANGLLSFNKKGGDFEMFTIKNGVCYIDMFMDGDTMTIWEAFKIFAMCIPVVAFGWLFIVLAWAVFG